MRSMPIRELINEIKGLKDIANKEARGSKITGMPLIGLSWLVALKTNLRRKDITVPVQNESRGETSSCRTGRRLVERRIGPSAVRGQRKRGKKMRKCQNRC